MAGSVDAKLERFLSEKATFRDAVKKIFLEADVDKNGILTRKEVAAVTDKLFDSIGDDLAAYDMQFSRPREGEIDKLLTEVDKDANCVLTEDEFFEFYRRVIKYYTAISSEDESPVEEKGFIRRFLPKVLAVTAGVFGIKVVTPHVPNVGSSLEPILDKIPALIAGPILGVLCVFATEGDKYESFKKEVFQDTKKKDT